MAAATAPGKATSRPSASRSALREVSGSRKLLHAAMGGVGEADGGPGPHEGPAQLGAPLPTLRWEQIRSHNLPGDKWLVIERRVYDISRWAQRHPGGSRLIGHHGAKDATVRKPTAGGAEPGARWGLVVGTLPCSTCGVFASFLLLLTFDLQARDSELGWTSQGLMWGKEATSLHGAPHPRPWTRAGLEQVCAGGRVSQRRVCPLPAALSFFLSVESPDQVPHAGVPEVG